MVVEVVMVVGVVVGVFVVEVVVVAVGVVVGVFVVEVVVVFVVLVVVVMVVEVFVVVFDGGFVDFAYGDVDFL